MSVDAATAFEAQRGFLLGLAYRLLGSRADAEDAVQDTFLRWREADIEALDNPAAWLTTVCTRRCLDMLKSAQSSRLHYVGTWLPEPIQHLDERTPEHETELASSLSTAFLLLLERLSPKERAAYLLHEIFDRPYTEVAATMGIEEAACRKLVSRARARVGQDQARHVPPRERQEILLTAFQAALQSGDAQPLAELLSDDIALYADGGGKVAALRRPRLGKVQVLDVLERAFHEWWRPFQWRRVQINGQLGVLLMDAECIIAALSFSYDHLGRASGIYIVRNPDKLMRLAP
jgi:RNA polymerase sigma factor (sigma-70 family)